MCEKFVGAITWALVKELAATKKEVGLIPNRDILR